MSNSDLSKVNCQQLLSLIQNSLPNVIEPFLFGPNTEATRAMVKTATYNYMKSLEQTGVIDNNYCVICDETNNPIEDISKGILNTHIYSAPISITAQYIFDDLSSRTIYRENNLTFRIPELLLSEIRQKIDDLGLKYVTEPVEKTNEWESEYTLTFADDTNSAQFMLYIAPDYKIELYNNT